MKMIKNIGFVFLASALIMPLFAFHSTITDSEAGDATNIVETDNVIHVYTYLGASPEAEAEFTSTFDEGEDWRAYVWTPKKTNVTTKINVTTTSGIKNSEYKTPYVQAIDNCLAEGNRWNHSTDVCE